MVALISSKSGSLSAMILRWALQGHHGSLVSRKQVLTFHANCLQWRQFAWNISSLFSSGTICMKCQSLFSGENKNKFTNSSSAEIAQREIRVKSQGYLTRDLVDVLPSFTSEVTFVTSYLFSCTSSCFWYRINKLNHSEYWWLQHMFSWAHY